MNAGAPAPLAGAAVAAVALVQLDLTPTPTPPKGVPLRAARQAVAELREQSARLGAAAGAADERQRVVLGAARAARNLAATQLHGATTLGPEDSAASAPGWRLMRALPALDPALRAALNLDDARWADAAPRIDQFAARADAADPDGAVEAAAALAELVAAILDGPLLRPWPAGADPAALRVAEPVPPPSAAASLILALPLGEPIVGLIKAATDAGEPLRAVRVRLTLAELVAIVGRLAAMSWIDRLDRARLDAIVTQVATATVTDATSLAVTEDLRVTVELLEAIDRVRRVDAERFQRLGPVLRLLRRLDDPRRFTTDGDHWFIDRAAGKRVLAAFVTRIADTSAEPIRVTAPPLVEAQRTLLRERRRIEDLLLTTIAELAEAPEVGTDPRLTAMLAAQRAIHDDLRRLASIDLWTQRIVGQQPQREAPLRQQLMKMTRWLVDPNRRPDADRAARELERQLVAFIPLPAEELLAARSLPGFGDGAAVDHAVAAVSAARDAWVQEWADGNGGGAATRLLWRWHRLLAVADTLHAITQPARREQVDRVLGRWPDWLIPFGMIERAARLAVPPLRQMRDRIDAPPPAQAAAQPNQRRAPAGPPPAAAEDLPRSAERAAALPRLAVVVAGSLAPVLDPHVDGPLPQEPRRDEAALRAAGSLLAPPRDAWLASSRPALLQLGMATMELDAALAEGAHADVELLDVFVNALADDLLDRVRPRLTEPPTLAGFDGSDREARR